MKLFRKKQESNKNQIENKELKEKIADTVLTLLINEGEINQDSMLGITIEFGYLLLLNNEIEALLKVAANNNVYYFAVQKRKMLFLTIDERQFQETVQYMINYHLGDE